MVALLASNQAVWVQIPMIAYDPITQWTEWQTVNLLVVGSNPTRVVNSPKSRSATNGCNPLEADATSAGEI